MMFIVNEVRISLTTFFPLLLCVLSLYFEKVAAFNSSEIALALASKITCLGRQMCSSFWRV